MRSGKTIGAFPQLFNFPLFAKRGQTALKAASGAMQIVQDLFHGIDLMVRLGLEEEQNPVADTRVGIVDVGTECEFLCECVRQEVQEGGIMKEMPAAIGNRQDKTGGAPNRLHI